MVDENWVRTAAITTVTLTQQPGAPAVDDDELDGWLSASTIEAVTDEPPWPLEAAAAVLPVLEEHRRRAETLAARQHAAGMPGREAGDGVSTWRHLAVQLVFPPGVAPVEDLVTHAHRAVCSLQPPTSWRARLEAATLPLPAEALPAIEAQAGEWARSAGLQP